MTHISIEPPQHAGIAKQRFRSLLLLCLLLLAVTLAVYGQVASHQFINLDDNDYVTNNPYVSGGITAENVIWAFTTVHASNWHPVTWLSHMADVQLYGMNARGHHFTNVGIHAASTLLLFLLLVRLTRGVWQSLFVAALFALHPLHVESVAWVAERKDVLSAFFGFLTLYFYSEYAQKKAAGRYLLALVAFALGLMTKPMLVTFPLVMLLFDFWPLGRFRQTDPATERQPGATLASLVKEKIPFLLCAGASSFLTLYAQGKGGAIADLTMVPFRLRCENALVSTVTYLYKTIFPHDLAIYYPLPSSFPVWQVGSSALILITITVVVIRSRQSHPALAMGWFWFLLTLLPVIGLIHIGAQSMADRYTYIPSIGLFMMVAWSVPDLVKPVRYRNMVCALLAGVAIIVSILLSWRQLGYWRDGVSLYRHTLNVTTNNYIIHNNLGASLMSGRQVDAAIFEYRKALHIKPDHASAHHNLGAALHLKGDLDGAVQHYRASLQADPNNMDAHINLGSILAYKGYLDEAINEYRQVLTLNNNSCEAHYNVGLLLSRQGHLSEALEEYQQALRIEPGNMKVQFSMQRASEKSKILGK